MTDKERLEVDVSGILANGRPAGQQVRIEYLLDGVDKLGLKPVLDHILDREFDGVALDELTADDFDNLFLKIEQLVRVLCSGKSEVH